MLQSKIFSVVVCDLLVDIHSQTPYELCSSIIKIYFKPKRYHCFVTDSSETDTFYPAEKLLNQKDNSNSFRNYMKLNKIMGPLHHSENMTSFKAVHLPRTSRNQE